MTSGLQLTSSSAALYVRDMYRQMTSGLQLTSSSAALYVRDMYRQMTSGLKLTSSSAAIYVRDMYRQMTSGLQLTSSSAALYVRDMYRQMTSGLELTSSSAAIYVRDTYRQMTSGLALTSSSAAIYVRDMYRQMKSGLEITSSSAAIYARSKENAAEIVARINESTGQSEILLNAQKVYIGNESTKADVVINGKLSASTVTGDWICAKITASNSLTVNNILANSINVVVGQGTSPVATQTYVSGCIWDLRITGSGASRKIQKKALGPDSASWVDVGNFSEAVSVSGGWVGNTNTYKATASYTETGEEIDHVSVIPSLYLESSQGAAYLKAAVATYGSGGTATVRGSKTTLYLVQSGTTVYVKDQDSTSAGTIYAQMAVSGGHSTSHSNGIWDTTFYTHPEHGITEKTQMYCYINGTLQNAGTYYWYHRDTYMIPQTVYT